MDFSESRKTSETTFSFQRPFSNRRNSSFFSKKFFCTTSPFGKSIDLPTSRNSTLTPKASVKHIKRKPNRPDTYIYFFYDLRDVPFLFFTLPVYIYFRNNSTIMYGNGFSIYLEPYGKIMYTRKIDAWANYRVDFRTWIVVVLE